MLPGSSQIKTSPAHTPLPLLTTPHALAQSPLSTLSFYSKGYLGPTQLDAALSLQQWELLPRSAWDMSPVLSLMSPAQDNRLGRLRMAVTSGLAGGQG